MVCSVRIRYTSELSSEYLEELQELMFFNDNQRQFVSDIVASIDEFGEPTLKSEGGFLRICTSRLGEVQSLFAVEENDESARPVGVAVHVRNAEDTLTLLHIGVHSEFASDGTHADEMVAMNLIRRLVEIGRQIKGIRRIVIHYGPETGTVVPIRR